MACDECVLDGGVEAGRYAGALGRWAERAAANAAPAGVMGLGRSRALIIRRIEMLLSPSRILRRNGGRWAFAGSLAAALGASLALVISGPVVIRAQTAAEPLAVEVEADVQPVVDVAVPVAPVVPNVHVKPVLVSQAAPPAPPAPIAAPGPIPAPVPVPPVPPLPPASAAEREGRANARAGHSIRILRNMGSSFLLFESVAG